MSVELVIEPTGNIHCVYAETIELQQLGILSIMRGSHVEPTCDGRWTADMSPVKGPLLGPFNTRTLALDAELAWLHRHWLTATK